jgi:hypothetical protein
VAIERHVISLEAKDAVTPALQKIATQVQRTSQQVEQGNQRAARSSQDWSRAASGLGLALGGITLAATRFAQESEVSQQRLQASIEATGASYDDYADAVDNAARSALNLAFDDEEALDALNALTQGTGDTSRALEDLALVEDIARARGIDLAAAAKIVIAAEQGRIGSLKRLGIAIDENASSEEALAALQTKFAGQAEAYADTNAATWDRVQNSIENALEGAGGALVDYQGLILGVSTAGAALGPLSDAFTAIGGKAKLAAAGTGALSLAMGPLGIAAAAAAGAAGIYLLIKSLDGGDDSLKASEANVSNLQQALADLAGEGVSSAVTQQIGNFAGTLQDVARSSVETSAELDRVREAGLDYAQMLDSNLAQGNDAAADAARRQLENLNALAEELDRDILTGEQFTQMQQDLVDIFTDPNPLNSGLVEARLAELRAEWEAGTISADDLAWNIHFLNENSDTYGLTLEEQARQQAAAGNEMGNSAEEAAALAENMKVVAQRNKDARAASEQLNDELIALAGTIGRNMPEAAGNAFQQVVGFTQGMVDAIGTSADWANALVSTADGVSRLDQIMAGGQLDAEDYNEVLRETGEINDANARAIGAANEIQVKQIDIVSEGADATADYLESIAKLPEAEQALALAWADQDLAGRATEIAEMAGQFDQMGSAQQQAFASMVESAANTDPQLARVLESLGLIVEKTDGTYELKVPTDQAKSDTELLIDAIDRLTAAITGVPNVAVDATLDTAGFWETWNALPDQKTIVTYTRFGGVIGPSPELALGGMVPWGGDTAALGRMSRGRTTLVGENGPELVNLPGGSTVIPNHASRYMTDRSGGSFVIQNMTVIANDPQSFMAQMRDYASTMERR